MFKGCDNRIRRLVATLALTVGLAVSSPVWGQGKTDTGDLAKAAQNPIADMISLPFQNNTSFRIGPNDRTQNILNIQPVVPFNLSEDWLLVTRTIVPLVWQPDLTQTSGTTFGLGDINPTFWFAAGSKITGLPKTLTIGVGPTFLLPTATSDQTGSGKWGIGPSAVVIWTPGKWVVGGLINNIWSFAGQSDRRDVNQMLIQPILNYNLVDGWYLVSAPIITANWEAPSNARWVVPVGGGFGKIFHVGKQAVNATLQGYVNTVQRDTGPDWQLRFQVQLLFPKGK